MKGGCGGAKAKGVEGLDISRATELTQCFAANDSGFMVARVSGSALLFGESTVVHSK